MPPFSRQCRVCAVISAVQVTGEIFRLDCVWPGSAPKAGQFFMLKPLRSSVFLPRPVSAALWEADGPSWHLGFFIARRGTGTEELTALIPGEELEISGPLGSGWEDFLPPRLQKPAALVGGGAGAAPLLSLPAARPGAFDFYAGFKTSFESGEELSTFLGAALIHAQKFVLSVETGTEALSNTGIEIRSGRITDFLEPADYGAVCACGPEPMLRAAAKKCRAAEVPCYVSLERRMACGVGACLGCTVETVRGNKRCCVDGPIFNAEEIFF
jgi:NAD(P)H-flavin reductase